VQGGQFLREWSLPDVSNPAKMVSGRQVVKSGSQQGDLAACPVVFFTIPGEG